MDTSAMRVVVPVAGLWTSRDAPRTVDEPAVANVPDLEAWLSAMDAEGPDGANGRGGLVDRLETQVLRGEEVVVVSAGGSLGLSGDSVDGWVQVVCPAQTTTKDVRGYPGWVRAAHVAATVGAQDDLEPLQPTAVPGAEDFLAAARSYGSAPYLWGGLTRDGIDCSGLVHLALRELGVLVPRDAADQQSAVPALDASCVRPGDLYFFARDGQPAHHVGIVTDAGSMIHAPMTGAVVVEERLDEERLATLCGAARIFP